MAVKRLGSTKHKKESIHTVTKRQEAAIPEGRSTLQTVGKITLQRIDHPLPLVHLSFVFSSYAIQE